jgi:hypothetical protein
MQPEIRHSEDYVDFSTFTGFMNSESWAIIEKVKIPAGATQGWHMFRGKADEDLVGDVAMQMRNDVDIEQVHCWVRTGGWISLQMDKNDIPGLEILDDTWYTICLQYDAVIQKLELYVNGNFIEEITSIAPIDDSSNNNKMFFGGQDVDPAQSEGDLYSECDVVIAHQAWLQRMLTPTEISNYNGTFNTGDSELFFATEITASDVIKAGGTGGADGKNGNSPEFYLDNM